MKTKKILVCKSRHGQTKVLVTNHLLLSEVRLISQIAQDSVDGRVDVVLEEWDSERAKIIFGL